MKRKLKSIAMQLTESDIQELIRFKKQGGKKTETLRKKREKLAAELARIDAEIKRLTGEEPAPVTGKRQRGRPRLSPIQKAKPGRKKGAGPRVNISAGVREVFKRKNEPLRARDVVERFPSIGIKVPDESEMRKRVSVVLAQAKDTFEQVERGVYRMKSGK